MIETERCIIRLPALNEAHKVVSYYTENKEHLEPWVPIIKKEAFTLKYWTLKAKDAQTEYKNKDSIRLHIFLKNNDELIGMINFTRIVRGVFQCCGLGYQISGKYEGKGYMTESLKASINHIFAELNFHRIEANVIPLNIRSQTLLNKLRFVKEGYAKDYLYIAGKWQDHVLNSLTNDHWMADI